ncbi:MAG: leucyl/phenylalanyl-tRNA--protein transferase [Congregibacter sp.]
MALLTYLEPGEPFPATSNALSHPNGLLAAGGSLDTATLLAAYRRGLFPWYEAPQPILWWSPDPRSVLFPDEFHLAKSLRKTLRNTPLTLSMDSDFEAVVSACAAPRARQQGTWIDDDMRRAYTDLHRQGWAHSVETRGPDGELLGGLYGVAIGAAFFGESMFSRCSDASKIAFAGLVSFLRERGYALVDCQIESDHMNSLGARNVSRVDFEECLAHTIDKPMPRDPWNIAPCPADLLTGFEKPAQE